MAKITTDNLELVLHNDEGEDNFLPDYQDSLNKINEADKQRQADISAEESARVTGDTAEEAARLAGDNALQAGITALSNDARMTNARVPTGPAASIDGSIGGTYPGSLQNNGLVFRKGDNMTGDLVGTGFLTPHTDGSSVAYSPSHVSIPVRVRATSATSLGVTDIQLSWYPYNNAARPLDNEAIYSVVPVYPSLAGFHRIKEVASVAWYVDDPTMSGSPYSTQTVAPFAINGSNANQEMLPWATSSLSAGSHTLTALVTYDTGWSESATATFWNYNTLSSMSSYLSQTGIVHVPRGAYDWGFTDSTARTSTLTLVFDNPTILYGYAKLFGAKLTHAGAFHIQGGTDARGANYHFRGDPSNVVPVGEIENSYLFPAYASGGTHWRAFAFNATTVNTRASGSVKDVWMHDIQEDAVFLNQTDGITIERVKTERVHDFSTLQLHYDALQFGGLNDNTIIRDCDFEGNAIVKTDQGDINNTAFDTVMFHDSPRYGFNPYTNGHAISGMTVRNSYVWNHPFYDYNAQQGTGSPAADITFIDNGLQYTRSSGVAMGQPGGRQSGLPPTKPTAYKDRRTNSLLPVDLTKAQGSGTSISLARPVNAGLNCGFLFEVVVDNPNAVVTPPDTNLVRAGNPTCLAFDSGVGDGVSPRVRLYQFTLQTLAANLGPYVFTFTDTNGQPLTVNYDGRAIAYEGVVGVTGTQNGAATTGFIESAAATQVAGSTGTITAPAVYVQNEGRLVFRSATVFGVGSAGSFTQPQHLSFGIASISTPNVSTSIASTTAHFPWCTLQPKGQLGTQALVYSVSGGTGIGVSWVIAPEKPLPPNVTMLNSLDARSIYLNVPGLKNRRLDRVLAEVYAAIGTATSGLTKVIIGSGPPSNSIGNDGDGYMDRVNSTAYGPKTSGAWGAGTSYAGAAGSTGAVGPSGNPGYLRVNGANAETLLSGRTAALTTQGGFTSGRAYGFAVQLAAGQVISSVQFMPAVTSSGVATGHSWYFLADSSGNLLRATADDLVEFTAGSVKKLNLVSSYTVPTDGLYYVGVCAVAATTMPSFKGLTGDSNTIGLTPRLNWVDNSHTGLTTPASAPSTFTMSQSVNQLLWAAC